MSRVIILFLISGILISSACNNTPDTSSEAEMTSIDLPNDFVDFLDSFHSSSDFQKSHIQWPLQGLPPMMDDSDTTLNLTTFRWTPDDWVMHVGFSEDNEEYEQSYSMFGDDMIVEQILHINGSMGMERRFAKRDDTWNLIYYAGMNLIKK